MTKIKFFAFILFSVLITSCSSGDDSNDNQETGDASFQFVYNNQEKKISSWEAIKIDDLIEVTGQTADGIGLDLKFNVYGNLYQGFTHRTSAASSMEMYEVSETFTSNTFNFTLEELNTANKTIKVKFSGKLYLDGYDSDVNYITDPSKFIPVSGSFNVAYRDVTSNISGLGTSAKIDGKDWHGLSFSHYEEWATHVMTLDVENDGEYTLGIVFPNEDLKTGVFPFTSNEFSNRISFKKFDLARNEFIDYNVSGTITYSAVNDYYVEGTFSLTATHPVDNSKIVITNGKFKETR